MKIYLLKDDDKRSNILFAPFGRLRALSSPSRQKLVSGITYLRTGEGWLYLTTVIDLYNRKVVGWAMSDGMEATYGVKSRTITFPCRYYLQVIHHLPTLVNFLSFLLEQICYKYYDKNNESINNTHACHGGNARAGFKSRISGKGIM